MYLFTYALMVYCTIIANYRRCDLVIHYWTNIHMARFPELVIHVLRIYQFTNSHSTNEPNYMRACQLFPQHTDTQICQFAIGWMCMSTNLPMPCQHLHTFSSERVYSCTDLPMDYSTNAHACRITNALVWQCTSCPNEWTRLHIT